MSRPAGRLIFADLGSRFGGAEGTRTPDPLHAMQVRYQLRHSPKHVLLRGSNRRKQPDQLNRNLRAAPIGKGLSLQLSGNKKSAGIFRFRRIIRWS